MFGLLVLSDWERVMIFEQLFRAQTTCDFTVALGCSAKTKAIIAESDRWPNRCRSQVSAFRNDGCLAAIV
jgi:hypothetical protein